MLTEAVLWYRKVSVHGYGLVLSLLIVKEGLNDKQEARILKQGDLSRINKKKQSNYQTQLLDKVVLDTTIQNYIDSSQVKLKVTQKFRLKIFTGKYTVHNMHQLGCGQMSLEHFFFSHLFHCFSASSHKCCLCSERVKGPQPWYFFESSLTILGLITGKHCM